MTLLSPSARSDIRHAVQLAVQFWPNAHLGAYAPREDIRSAFCMIRNRLNRGECIQSACGAVEADALRYSDM